MSKQCKDCLRSLEDCDFYKNYRRKEGYDLICKECKRQKRLKSEKYKYEKPERDDTDNIPAHLKQCLECNKTLPLNSFKDISLGICKNCEKYKDEYIVDILIDSKECVTCKVIKKIDDFGISKGHKDGHLKRCKVCCNIKSREVYQKNIEYSREYSRNKELNTDRYRRWVRQTIANHKRQDVKITIDRNLLYEYAISITNCEFCRTELLWVLVERRKGVKPNSPTLENLLNKDIISSIDDVAIVCHRCNTAKGDKNINEFIEYIQDIAPNLKNLRDSKQIIPESSILEAPEVQDSQQISEYSLTHLEV